MLVQAENPDIARNASSARAVFRTFSQYLKAFRRDLRPEAEDCLRKHWCLVMFGVDCNLAVHEDFSSIYSGARANMEHHGTVVNTIIYLISILQAKRADEIWELMGAQNADEATQEQQPKLLLDKQIIS